MKKRILFILLSLAVSAGFIIATHMELSAAPCAVHIVNRTGTYFVGKVDYTLNSTKKTTSDKLHLIRGKSSMIWAMCGTWVKVYKKNTFVKQAKASSNKNIYID